MVDLQVTTVTTAPLTAEITVVAQPPVPNLKLNMSYGDGVFEDNVASGPITHVYPAAGTYTGAVNVVPQVGYAIPGKQFTATV